MKPTALLRYDTVPLALEQFYRIRFYQKQMDRNGKRERIRIFCEIL